MNLSYTIPKAEENILSGIKIHTLRTDKTKRWKQGMKIHHCYSFRSKHGYYCFEVGKCVSVQKVLLVITGSSIINYSLNITVDRKRLTGKQITKFIKNDGFENVTDFINWFFNINSNGSRKKTMWAGVIIHWTNFKY